MQEILNQVRVLAFDADDTLWHTENHFQSVQMRLAEILDHYAAHDQVQAHLHEIEMQNIKLFGYGVKGFTLSMIEAAIEISENKIKAADIHEIVLLGKSLLDAPMDLMTGVDATLTTLGTHYDLYLITKGDVLDQQNKIVKSGLAHHFVRTEVVQEKDSETYKNLFSEFQVAAREVAMIGNSLKSDILPVLELGGVGIHIPYHVTASFERHDDAITDPHFMALAELSDLVPLFCP